MPAPDVLECFHARGFDVEPTQSLHEALLPCIARTRPVHGVYTPRSAEAADALPIGSTWALINI